MNAAVRRAPGRPPGTAGRLPEDLVARMHADYLAGLTLNEVGRKHGGRHHKTVRRLFVLRGWEVRSLVHYGTARTAAGTFARYVPATPAQIDAIVEAATRIVIPEVLRTEWRDWPLARRAAFVARLRAKVDRWRDRPDLPFSANVEPFDYGSARAHELAEAMNAGTTSRNARLKLDIASQGVIWRGRLFFWSAEGKERGVGAYYVGPWTPEGGRPAVHRLIWEDHHGRPVPPRLVVFPMDGNRNNLDPANLDVCSKNDVCRRNQARALTRKSRALTAALLNRSQPQPNQDQDQDHARHPDAFAQIARLHRAL